MKRKIFACITASALCLSLAACGGASNSGSSETDGRNSEPVVSDNSDKMSGAISIVSREDGSGTRGAFIELFGIEKKDADGNKVDYTTDKAEVTNSTSVMMQTVA
ncbi:MAG: phosphate ABC transporter substrate-binding protein, partial [Oscillospiraceae bacterium]